MKRLVALCVLAHAIGCTSVYAASLNDVDSLRSSYRDLTGNNLPAPANLEICKGDINCIYDEWKNVYEWEMQERSRVSGMEAGNKKQTEDQAEEVCIKSAACSKKDVVTFIKNMLFFGANSIPNGVNIFVVTCQDAEKAYHRGIRRESIVEAGYSTDMVAFENIGFVAEAAGICWDATKDGINWRGIVRQTCGPFQCH